ncbi:hypothetical protein GNI_080740 [Gregarina niphandrodes]|uniref:Uncharacterized protein n=1 Tax=Gregarina niphandrodes TaxID=110365 RepID=A0A023B6F1_GRENI|nr:hypothetical protein GNI_080740 [Gregarina niphandrodes]EZG66411.1 hypothetical protein GNI_080740 [Gregarina niphandrodes]|eukprot:XP_011134003.1 hypothetical protein GNI_080740 [Gregarina niphandrodes]
MQQIKEEPFGEHQLWSLSDCATSKLNYSQPARESICVMGQPLDTCPRCKEEGLGLTVWKPHRHIGEMKIRYICERNFQELESPHHFDVPLCPLCSCVLYLYIFNTMIGATNARKLHKYALKCSNKHVLPLLDVFCLTRKGSSKCRANLKLQWCYGTMVARCESQKNRDHDLWWVRYKNEWKQRRTMIRYKKDFLSHLSDSQRGLLLSLGLEGDPPPDPKNTLGPTFDTLLSLSTESWKKRSTPATPPTDSVGSDQERLRKKKRFSKTPPLSSEATPRLFTELPFNDLITGTPISWAAQENGDENENVVKNTVSVVGQVVCFPLLLPLPRDDEKHF